MKRVVDSNEVPHLWAHKSQDSARSKGRRNLYFDGDVIYSYGSHFPIARHVANEKGATAVLFTTKSYSVTTSAHCGMVRSAVSHLTVFRVPNVHATRKADHRTNLKDYRERIEAAVLAAAKARKADNKVWRLKEARELLNEAENYAAFFNVPAVLPEVPALDSTVLTDLRKREREQAAKARAVAEKENAAAIEAWRSGASVSLPYGLSAMLRVKGDEVETSLGARFPIEHARKALAIVKRVIASGEVYVRNGHTIHLGEYAIDRIEADGTVKAGCHTVAWGEIERLGL